MNAYRLRIVGLLTLCATALIVPLVPAPYRVTPVEAAGPTVNGGGSSFAKLEIDQWRAEVARKPFNLEINYAAQGSTFGRQSYMDGSLDFGASDIPYTTAEFTSLRIADSPRKDFVYVPVSAGGLGIMYNLIDQSGNPVKNLNLTRRVVCRMFTEDEMFWNDPEIQSVNPDIALPAKPVGSVGRADGSGTSYVLSEYCIDVAPEVWSAFRAIVPASEGSVEFSNGQPTSNWPQIGKNRVFAQGADGVAAAVADSSGVYSVTYNEAGFAKVRGFPNASVQNAAGVFTQPTEDAVSIALGYATEVDNVAAGIAAGITFKLNYSGSDPKAYFPSTYSYVIAPACPATTPQATPPCSTASYPSDKGEVLARFLCYAVTKGQRKDLTDALGYARLSAPLVELARKAIARIPGAPPWEQCKVESAPPPAAATTLPPTATTQPPAGGGTTVPRGTVAPGGTPTTSIVRDPVTGNTTVITSPGSSGSGGSGGGAVTATSIITDPITGATVVVTIPTANASGDCLDPVTGLPVDPTQCAAVLPDQGGGAAGAPPVVAAPAAQNPSIVPPETEIDTTEIVWWLAQGATVCAVGVALAGVRRRAS